MFGLSEPFFCGYVSRITIISICFQETANICNLQMTLKVQGHSHSVLRQFQWTVHLTSGAYPSLLAWPGVFQFNKNGQYECLQTFDNVHLIVGEQGWRMGVPQWIDSGRKSFFVAHFKQQDEKIKIQPQPVVSSWLFSLTSLALCPSPPVFVALLLCYCMYFLCSFIIFFRHIELTAKQEDALHVITIFVIITRVYPNVVQDLRPD